jgi:hypothetical protein
MFERIRSIDWARLWGAHGTSDAFPDLVVALRSSREEDRNNAKRTLREMVAHQGTAYEVTPYAVPFLQEIVRSDEVWGKLEALELLGTIHASGCGIGREEPDLVASLTPEDLARPNYALSACDGGNDEEIVDTINRYYPRWRGLAYEAVEWGSADYVELLWKGDAAVVAASLALLAGCRPTPEIIRQVAKRFTAEQDAFLRAACLHALRTLDGAAHRGTFERALQEGSSPERFVAAVALAGVAPSHPGLAETMVQLIEQVDPAHASELPGADPYASLATALGQLPRIGPAHDRALELLVDRFAVKVAKPLTLAGPLLKLAFPLPLASGTPLTAVQERVLVEVGQLAWGRPPRGHQFAFFAAPIDALGLAGTARRLLGFD